MTTQIWYIAEELVLKGEPPSVFLGRLGKEEVPPSGAEIFYDRLEAVKAFTSRLSSRLE